MTLEQIFAVQEDAPILKPAVAAQSSTANQPVQPSSSSSPDVLTAREIEVLRLMTTGLTNPQIAGHWSSAPQRQRPSPLNLQQAWRDFAGRRHPICTWTPVDL